MVGEASPRSLRLETVGRASRPAQSNYGRAGVSPAIKGVAAARTFPARQPWIAGRDARSTIIFVMAGGTPALPLNLGHVWAWAAAKFIDKNRKKDSNDKIVAYLTSGGSQWLNRYT